MKFLGFDWGEHLYYATDHCEKFYDYAVNLIKEGKAYVGSLTPEEIEDRRGTLTEPVRESLYRNRPAEENLDLFTRIRGVEFEDGTHVLRAKIDIATPNINMQGPILFWIRNVSHLRTRDN